MTPIYCFMSLNMANNLDTSELIFSASCCSVYLLNTNCLILSVYLLCGGQYLIMPFLPKYYWKGGVHIWSCSRFITDGVLRTICNARYSTGVSFMQENHLSYSISFQLQILKWFVYCEFSLLWSLAFGHQSISPNKY